MDNKAKQAWDKTKDKAEDIADKAKAEYHEAHGRMEEKMQQMRKPESRCHPWRNYALSRNQMCNSAMELAINKGFTACSSGAECAP